VDVTVYNDQKYAVFQSKEGLFLRFTIEEIPEKKKAALGVRAMKLAENDEIEAVYFLKGAAEYSITYKDKQINPNSIRLNKRDSKGVKIRV